MNFTDKVYEKCKLIPKGKVSTYKQIALSLNSKAYQAIGKALSKNKNKDVPCHRVICNNGEIGGFRGSIDNEDKKILLEKEGILIFNNKINLKEFLYKI